MVRVPNVATLDQWRERGRVKDENHFSEQRIHAQLVACKHFKYQNMTLPSHIYLDRDGKTSVEIPINYLGKYARIKQNKLVMHAPMVHIVDKSGNERVDRSAADLAQKIWADIVYRHEFKHIIKDWAFDYTVLGECIARISWDPQKGTPVQSIPNNMIDISNNSSRGAEDGIVGDVGPSSSESLESTTVTMFSGDLSIERVEPWNLIRPEECKDIKDAEWLCIDRFINRDTIKSWFPNDADMQNKISASMGNESATSFMYDMSQGFYEAQNLVRVSEMYFRPCAKYPYGYYIFFTNNTILYNGELPFGIFPILHRGQLRTNSNPRGHSLLRDGKPIQAEINRCFGQAIEHSLSLGDDKIFLPEGSKIPKTVKEPGCRILFYSSPLNFKEPVIVSGRTGMQHVEQGFKFIDIMKDLFNEVDPNAAGSPTPTRAGTQNIMGMLFSSSQDREKNAFYASDFEDFLVRTCDCILKIVRNFYTDEQLMTALGESDFASAEDFKNHKLRDTIEVEPTTHSTFNTFGRQHVFDVAMQYASKYLQPKDVGLILQAMPLGNKDVAFQGLVFDQKIADGLIRNLDNGRDIPINPLGEDIPFMIKNLISRIKDPGFINKPPFIQELYNKKLMEYQQIEAQQQQLQMQLDKQMIPVDGPLVKIGTMNVPNTTGGSKATVPLRLPEGALKWLREALDQRGMTQERLVGMDMATKNRILTVAQQIAASGQGGQPQESQQSLPPPQSQQMAGQPDLSNVLGV